jgi:ABC-2 type transport system permease protein
MQPEPTTPAGAIYDIGYQHYDGKRLGRAGAIRALFVQGLRSLFGIGRGGKAKIPPLALIFFMLAPAIVQVAIVGVAGNMLQLFTHAGYFHTTVWIFGLFCAFQTPELVSSDQQHRVLSLYFSRALLRSDYILARVASLFTALFVVALLPHILLLLGTWFAAEDVAKAMRDSLSVIPRILAAAFVIALLLSTVSITVAALIKRRPFATAAILALFLLASAFVVPLVRNRPEKMRYLILASPMLVGEGSSDAIFDTTSVKRSHDSVDVMTMTPLPLGPNGKPAPIDSVTRENRRERRRQMARRTIVDIVNLPPVLYFATTFGLIIVAAGVLTLRYRSIDA